MEVKADRQELEVDDGLVVIHLELDEAPPPGTDRIACRTPVPCTAGDRVVIDLSWPGMPPALTAGDMARAAVPLDRNAVITHGWCMVRPGGPLAPPEAAWLPATSPALPGAAPAPISRQPVLVWLRETMDAMAHPAAGCTQEQRDVVQNILVWGRPEGGP